MLPDREETVSLSEATSGSAFRIGSAISSTGEMEAMEMAIPASAEKAPITWP